MPHAPNFTEWKRRRKQRLTQVLDAAVSCEELPPATDGAGGEARKDQEAIRQPHDPKRQDDVDRTVAKNEPRWEEYETGVEEPISVADIFGEDEMLNPAIGSKKTPRQKER